MQPTKWQNSKYEIIDYIICTSSNEIQFLLNAAKILIPREKKTTVENLIVTTCKQ